MAWACVSPARAAVGRAGAPVRGVAFVPSFCLGARGGAGVRMFMPSGLSAGRCWGAGIEVGLSEGRRVWM